MFLLHFSCFLYTCLSHLRRGCLQDLDLTKPGVRKPPRKYEFEVTTKEVLRKADFRVHTCQFLNILNFKECIKIIYIYI